MRSANCLQLLSPPQIAAIIGKVLGRQVKYQNAPMTLFLKAAKSLGYADFVIEELHSFLLDYQRGSFGVGAPTDSVREVGQSEPEPFDHIAQRYIAASGFERRTVGSMARAIGNLIKTLLTTAADPKRIARQLELPAIEHAGLAADSVAWHDSHATRG